MLRLADQTASDHVEKQRFLATEQNEIDSGILGPLPNRDWIKRPKLNSFYAVIVLAIASWLVIGGLASAIYLMM